MVDHNQFRLSGFVGGADAVYTALRTDPEFTASKYKSVGAAMERGVVLAQKLCVKAGAALIQDTLYDAFNQFLQRNGPRPSGNVAEAEEWDSAVDDALANVFEPYARGLSADWLGRKTVDMRPQNDGEIEKLSNDFGAELWRQMTYEDGRMTTNKIMSAIGITTDDMSTFLDSLKPQTEQVQDMNMNAVLNRIMLNVGDKDVSGDLGLVLDDSVDPFIIGQARDRLGIDDDDVETLRTAELSGHNADSMSALVSTGEILDEADDATDGAPELAVGEANVPGGVMSLEPGTVPGQQAVGLPLAADVPALAIPAAPGVETVALEAPKPGRKRSATPAGPVAGAVDPGVLTTLKENLSMKDEDVAAALGLSRATYNNYTKGKQAFVPSDAQRAALHEFVRSRINAAIMALSELDGIAYDTIDAS